MRLRWTTAALFGAASLLFTGLAHAAVTVTSLTAEPASLQAGASPDLPLKAELATSGGDDVRHITVSLAPGVAAALGAITPCAADQFNADSCPAGSQIGGGSVTAATLAGDVDAAARLFVLAAAGGLPRIGLDVKALGQRITSIADVAVRSAPDVGVDILFKDLPREFAGQAIFFKKLDVKINGTTSGGAPFTRNATACSELRTRVSIVTYDVSAPVTAEDAFTPTGCGTLAFAPALAASAVRSGVDGVELTTVLTQAAGEAAQRKATLSLPSGVAPRISALSRACPAAIDIAACPAGATVGSATATTPLLPGTLTGKIVLKSQSAGLPLLSIVFAAPVPLRLDGTTQLGASGAQTTFDNIPDVPLGSLTVKLDGGAGGILQASSSLCSGGQTVGGAFTAQSGKTSSVSAPLAVTGCPVAGPGGTPPPAVDILAQLAGKLTFSSLAGTAKLVTTLTLPSSGAGGMTLVKLSLPSGLSVVKRRLANGVSVTDGGRRVPVTSKSTSRSVTLTLPSSARSAKITVGKGALKASASLRRRVRARKGGTLTVKAKVLDSAGKFRTLSLQAKAR